MITHTYAKSQAATGGKVHVSYTWNEDEKSGTGILCGVDMAQSRISFRAIRRGYLTVATEPVTCAKCLRLLAKNPAIVIA